MARSIKREILKVRRQLAMQHDGQSATEMDDVHSLDTTGTYVTSLALRLLHATCITR